MNERLETRKYTFTVEGETEKWYFEWLENQINVCPHRLYNVSDNRLKCLSFMIQERARMYIDIIKKE